MRPGREAKHPSSSVAVKKCVESCLKRGTRWCSWLRLCATSREVENSIPDGVIGISHLLNPCGRNVVLGSAQSLIDMSKTDTSWKVKAAATLPPSRTKSV